MSIPKKHTPKFKIGDRVKVVNYGHAVWSCCDDMALPLIRPASSKDDSWVFDMNRAVVGKKGIVVEVLDSGSYALSGIPEKTAWYNEDQLQLVPRKSSLPNFKILYEKGVPYFAPLNSLARNYLTFGSTVVVRGWYCIKQTEI